MDMKNSQEQAGSLFIATDVVEKVAKLSSLEVEGVGSVSTGSSGVKGMFAKTNLPKAVEVAMYDGVAEITINIIAKYGFKVPAVCKAVQEAVKSGVQSMTNITVSKVNVVVSGIETDKE
ncbi:MAG: Asp23/Gls24 family envelope stress response protein [Oscillospiraceae bacterium]